MIDDRSRRRLLLSQRLSLLDRDVALRAITINPARDRRLGQDCRPRRRATCAMTPSVSS
jgi:hypothetical protein